MAYAATSFIRLAVVTVATLTTSAMAYAQAPRPRAPAQPTRPSKPAPPKPPAPGQPIATAPAPPPPVSPDMVVSSRYTTGDLQTTSTASFKGARARIELGADLVSVQQCDASRIIQLNTRTKTYLATPFASADTPAVPAGDKRKGGQITFTTTVTDTGETQDILGFPARRFKTLIVKESTASACDRVTQRVETDGWYIEAPPTLTCVTLPPRESATQPDPQRDDCVDQVSYGHDGPRVGYPVRYTTVNTVGSAAPATTSMEVSDIRRVDVPADAVDIPADYLEVRSVSQLTADHRPGEAGPKKPGVLRVGVAPVTNRTDATASTAELTEALLESLSESEFEVVRLAGTSPTEIEADARAKECDFVLQNTITELKLSRGGMMSRISGGSSEGFNARVEFALVVPGQTKPAYASSERSGASTLSKAVVVVKKAAQFAPPVMMARYSYMNAYGSLLNPGAAAAPGGMPQTSDPVLNSAFALLDRATAGSAAAEQYGSEDAAVASAMEKEVRAVFGELAKRKK